MQIIFGEQVPSYTIGNSVTNIGSSAFSNCTGLTSVTIPNSVSSIGDGAFENCSSLSSITIPNSVTNIESGAFKGCSGLTKVIVKDIGAWCNISFKNGLSNPLYYAKHLYSDENTEITNLVIPNRVKNIGDNAFYGCSSLTTITIPNSVTSIGYQAFDGCICLTKIYCYKEEPLYIVYSVFSGVPKNGTLHVPIGCGDAYRNADVWKEFYIVEDLTTGIVSIDNSRLTNDNDVWYTLSGTRLNGKPTKAGIYIVNGKKVMIK